MKFFDLYVNYFKHQAEAHPALLHNDATGRRVFAVISVDEALGDFRAGLKPKGYLMRLLEYSYRVSDAGNHEVVKMHEGGFLVAHHHSAREGGSAAYFEALAKSEKVLDEIIEKMIADSQNGHPLFYYSLDSRQDFQVSPLRFVGDASYAGYLCLFSFKTWWRNCLDSQEAPAWADGGQTPFELPYVPEQGEGE
jgi:hypothetical protein